MATRSVIAIPPDWPDDRLVTLPNGQQITAGEARRLNTAAAGAGSVTGSGVSGAGSALGTATDNATAGTTSVGTDTGMSPLTGFASRYTPSQAQTAFENPWSILQDVFPGIAVSSPGYQSLRDFGADPLALFNIMGGTGGSVLDESGGTFINFMNELYKNLGTPGGQGFSARELLSQIFGQASNTGEEGVAMSPLAAILTAGDQSTQIRTLFNLLRDVSNVGMNPLAASAYQSAVAQAGDVYNNAMMRAPAGETVNPAQYFQANFPWLTGR